MQYLPIKFVAVFVTKAYVCGALRGIPSEQRERVWGVFIFKKHRIECDAGDIQM